jgi:hypothetical protein
LGFGVRYRFLEERHSNPECMAFTDGMRVVGEASAGVSRPWTRDKYPKARQPAPIEGLLPGKQW